MFKHFFLCESFNMKYFGEKINSWSLKLFLRILKITFVTWNVYHEEKNLKNLKEKLLNQSLDAFFSTFFYCLFFFPFTKHFKVCIGYHLNQIYLKNIAIFVIRLRLWRSNKISIKLAWIGIGKVRPESISFLAKHLSFKWTCLSGWS